MYILGTVYSEQYYCTAVADYMICVFYVVASLLCSLYLYVLCLLYLSVLFCLSLIYGLVPEIKLLID